MCKHSTVWDFVLETLKPTCMYKEKIRLLRTCLAWFIYGFICLNEESFLGNFNGDFFTLSKDLFSPYWSASHHQFSFDAFFPPSIQILGDLLIINYLLE